MQQQIQTLTMDAIGRVLADLRQTDIFVLAASDSWADVVIVVDVEVKRPVEDDEPFHNRVVAVAGRKDMPVGVGCNGIGHKDQASAAAVAAEAVQCLDKAIHWRNNALQSKDDSLDDAMAYSETSCNHPELVREGPYKSHDHRGCPLKPCNRDDHSSLFSPNQIFL